MYSVLRSWNIIRRHYKEQGTRASLQDCLTENNYEETGAETRQTDQNIKK